MGGSASSAGSARAAGFWGGGSEGGRRPPPSSLVARTRWGVLVVPALLYFLSYFHRVAPVVVAGDLMAAFAVSAASLGALSAIYPYCFAAMALPGGSLADFLGSPPASGWRSRGACSWAWAPR